MLHRLQTFEISPLDRAVGTSIGMTEEGLVLGRSILAPIDASAERVQSLWPQLDENRLLSLLSVAEGHPVPPARVMPVIEAAATHWRYGDKALANLRLAFADLPRLHDPADAARVALAEHLLDAGMPPDALMTELWPSWKFTEIEKFNPAHVPAGHGRRSGQFDFKAGSSHLPNDRIVVAEGGDDANSKDRERFGETTAKENFEHGRPITPSTGIPIFGGQGGATGGLRTIDTLSSMARAATDKVGPGKGPVYGTTVHSEVKAQVKTLGRDDLHPEQSYLNRKRVEYGTPGSVRPDFVEGSKDKPDRGYELKTGKAFLSPSRVKQFQLHLPLRDDDTEVPFHEFRP